MEFWRFVNRSAELGAPLVGSYDLALVTASVLVACLAGYAALEVAQRIGTLKQGRQRRVWVAIGAWAMGSGVWAMHFIGMLAFSLPVPIGYDLTITLLSMAPAVLASAVALHFMGREELDRRRLNLAGLLIGLGIGSMHYFGMEAMRADAVMRYNPILFAISIVVAPLLSIVALRMKFLVREATGTRASLAKVGSACVIGIAVAGMHYVAMAASRFFEAGGGVSNSDGTAEPAVLATGIGIITTLIMSLAIAGTAVDRVRADSGAIPLSDRRRVVYLAFIMLVVASSVLAVSLFALYRVAFEEERQFRLELVKTQARLIEAVARFDVEYSDGDVVGGAFEATMSQVRQGQAQVGTDRFTETGEFLAARIENGQMVWLLSDREPVSLSNSGLSEPMRRALSGESGTIVDLDYRGDMVLAAYEPVAVLDIGLVAKIDVAEIRRPFIRTATLAGLITLALVCVASALFVRVSNPMIAGLEERAFLEALISSAPTSITILDADRRVVRVNPAFERMFGYAADEVIGERAVDMLVPEVSRAEVEKTRQQSRATGEAVASEVQLTCKDGHAIWARLSTARVDGGGVAEGGMVVSCEDLTLIKSTEERLRQARDAAEAGTVAKTAFLANMSHEIRTPMNGVLGMTELLLDMNLGADQLRTAETIRSSAESLLAILNDILNLSKIEAGHIQIETIPFNVPKLMSNTARLLAVKASERGLELALDVGGDVPARAVGDPGRIRQVIGNLISNAVKFTEDGEIVVSVKRVGERDGAPIVRFAVRDTGIGIPAEKLEHVFEEFTQADSSTTRVYGGTGLGLPICRKLVALMGGTLEAASVAGQGSEFFFELSLEEAPDEEGADLRDALVDLEQKPVLVVDDNSTNRRIVRGILEAAGAQTDEADGADSALAAIRAANTDGAPYGVAIIDSQMPGRDGFDLAREVQNTAELADLQLIMLTSGATKGEGSRARDLGIAAYLTKPISRPDLLETLAAVLARPKTESADAATLITRHSIAEERPELSILLAEDNPVNQAVAGMMLRKRGHHVEVVEDGRAAVDAVQRGDYDIVLMDIEMPELDGIGATLEIREMPEHHDLPIIALTAHALTGERDRCLASGMTDFLSKPFNAHELFATVERWGMPATPSRMCGPTDTAADAAVASPPVALDRFRATMREAGAEEAVDAAIALYLDDAPQRMERLGKAVADADVAEIGSTAHSFKSASAMIGADSLAELLKKIEQAGEDGSAERAAECIEGARREHKAVLAYLAEVGVT